jgi:DNA polymerase III subunit alpha
VKGRVDHRDREKTCLVAQQIDRFEPTDDEVRKAEEEAAKVVLAPSALRLRLDASALPATALGELKDLLCGFPGDSDVVVELSTSVGSRRLKLGPKFRVSRGDAGLHAELNELLGEAIVMDGAPAPASAAAAGA